jgi:hypothetical protein
MSTNRPAFEPAEGMSLRDYFAAHAPPDWWRLKEPELPDVPRPWARHDTMIDTKQGEMLMSDAWRGYGEWLDAKDVSPELAGIFEKHTADLRERFRKLEEAWLAASMARETSWRWAYADAMLRARSGKEGGGQ